ncbi:MAG: hypothetical protein ACTSYF_17890 [Promethearchaeota archaeon]
METFCLSIGQVACLIIAKRVQNVSSKRVGKSIVELKISLMTSLAAINVGEIAIMTRLLTVTQIRSG